MSAERIDAMKQFIEQYPDNPFPRYALALEYKNAGRHQESVETFRALQARTSSYVPTYLQLGMLLEEMGLIDDAKAVYAQGVVTARSAGDGHALGELQGRLEGLQ